MSEQKDVQALYDDVNDLVREAAGILGTLRSNDNFTTLSREVEADALGAADRLLKQALEIHSQMWDTAWKQGNKAA